MIPFDVKLIRRESEYERDCVVHGKYRIIVLDYPCHEWGNNDQWKCPKCRPRGPKEEK